MAKPSFQWQFSRFDQPTRQPRLCIADPLCGKTMHMMTSSNGNILRFTGPLCGEFTGPRWIPRTKVSDAELWCFRWSAPWIKGWKNNGETGYLRRHSPYYDVLEMHRRLLAQRTVNAEKVFIKFHCHFSSMPHWSAEWVGRIIVSLVCVALLFIPVNKQFATIMFQQ